MNNEALSQRKTYSLHFIVLIALISLLFYGCALPKAQMYQGERVEDRKQAVIRVEQLKEDFSKVGILIVDGEWVFKYITEFSTSNLVGEVYVLPGKHTIVTSMVIRYHFLFEAHTSSNLWLVAEPGGKYVVKTVLKERPVQIQMWIENERTGKPVGGIVGSDDEP